MKCPFCGALQSAVLETRVSDDSSVIRRRRRCEACDKRFTTFERADVRLPQVIKKNNVRVDYQRDKLRASFALALRKRPVTSEQIDAAIARIEERLLAQGEREVSSRKIGEMVMQELTGLDKIAYIRFASVYRNFEDVNEFSEVIHEVETQPVAQRHEDE